MDYNTFENFIELFRIKLYFLEKDTNMWHLVFVFLIFRFNPESIDLKDPNPFSVKDIGRKVSDDDLMSCEVRLQKYHFGYFDWEKWENPLGKV